MDIYGYSHLHTKYTDGDLDLSKIKELLLNQGASFAFITEHREYFDAQKYEKYFQECRQLSDDKIIFVPGLEIAVGRNHILVLGVEKYYEDDSSINLLKRYKADGNLIIWAHPHRSRYLITADVSELLDGIEIWNSSYDTKYFPDLVLYNMLKRIIKMMDCCLLV